MKFRCSLLLLFVLAFVAFPLHAQPEAAGTTDRSIGSPSPNGRFAFLSTHQPGLEPQRTCDLVEKDSEKVLLRVAESDENQDWLGTSILWSDDSRYVAVGATYNHFGAELSVYLRRGDTFRKCKLSLPTAEVPSRRKPGHYDWKSTNINSQKAERWQKDGSLVVTVESTIAAIDGNMSLTATRTLVLGFDESSATAKVRRSTLNVTLDK